MFKHDLKKYEILVREEKNLQFIKENIIWSVSYYQLFQNPDHQYLNYLDLSVKLLQSTNSYFIRMLSKTKFDATSISYTSNGRFCSFSQEKKSKELRFQIMETLNYYQKEHLTHSFLTLAPKNIKNITKKDYQSLCLVLKEFWRDPIIKVVYKGYFGVEEVVEKSKTEFNVHFHFLCLRPLEFKQGYIKQKVLSQIWQRVCNKFGNEKIQGSFKVDIRAPQIYDEDKQLGAAKYILQYLAKGSKFKTQEARMTYIQATEGMRKVRSGGLLSQRFQRNIATKQNIESSFNEYKKQINNNNNLEILAKTTETRKVFNKQSYEEIENSSPHVFTNGIYDADKSVLRSLFIPLTPKIIEQTSLVTTSLEINPLPKTIKFGGKYITTKKRIYEISAPIEVKSDYFALNLLFGKPFSSIPKNSSYSFFGKVKESLFAKKKFICPLTGKKLEYKGIKNRKYTTDVESQYFQYFALENNISEMKKVPDFFNSISKELTNKIPFSEEFENDWEQYTGKLY